MIKLALVLLMKNEEDRIFQYLNTMSKLFDEVLIIDNMSSDNSVEIAKMFCKNIHLSRIYNDFAALNNSAINLSDADYLFFLDADEYISQQDIIQIRTTLNNNPTIDAAFINKFNYGGKNSMFVSRLIRLIRNDTRIQFSGSVFESPLDSINENRFNLVSINVTIHHFGFLSDYMTKIKTKYEKYCRIITDGSVGKYEYRVFAEIVRGSYNEALDLIDKVDVNSELLLMKGNLMVQIGDFYTALECYDNAIKIANSSQSIIDILNRKAQFFYLKHQFNEAEIYLNEALSYDENNIVTMHNISRLSLKTQDINKYIFYLNQITNIQPVFLRIRQIIGECNTMYLSCLTDIF